MRIRHALAGTAALLALGTPLVSAASATAQVPGPVTVTVTHYDGGTQVGTGVPGQPLFSVSDDSRGVCVGFSYEEGSCIPVTAS